MALTLQATGAAAGATPLTSPLTEPADREPPRELRRRARGATCIDAVVSALDTARASLGLARYPLPANFDSLSGARQIFILAKISTESRTEGLVCGPRGENACIGFADGHVLGVLRLRECFASRSIHCAQDDRVV